MKNNKELPEVFLDECQEFTKTFTHILIEACFNNIIESHITFLIEKSEDKYAEAHPFIGLHSCDIKRLDPYFHIIDQKDKKKRDEFLAWKENNPGKDVPPEINYEPKPHLGIKESETFVEVLLFFEYKCINYMKFPTSFYYELMSAEDLDLLKSLAHWMFSGTNLNHSGIN